MIGHADLTPIDWHHHHGDDGSVLYHDHYGPGHHLHKHKHVMGDYNPHFPDTNYGSADHSHEDTPE